MGKNKISDHIDHLVRLEAINHVRAHRHDLDEVVTMTLHQPYTLHPTPPEPPSNHDLAKVVICKTTTIYIHNLGKVVKRVMVTIGYPPHDLWEVVRRGIIHIQGPSARPPKGRAEGIALSCSFDFFAIQTHIRIRNDHHSHFALHWALFF